MRIGHLRQQDSHSRWSAQAKRRIFLVAGAAALLVLAAGPGAPVLAVPPKNLLGNVA